MRVRRLLGFRVWVRGHLGSGGFGGLEFLGSGFFSLRAMASNDLQILSVLS